jgi:hypothetical protein
MKTYNLKILRIGQMLFIVAGEYCKIWTYPASVDTSASRSVLSYQSNLLELRWAQIA